MTAKKKTSTPKASSTSSTKVAAKKVSVKNKGNFPTKELKDWLKGRDHWNHDDWLHLLDNMRKQGYANIVDSPEGQGKIGSFLETNRKHR